MENNEKVKFSDASILVKEPKKTGILKKSFISGLLVILPLWLTVVVIIILVKWVSSFSMPILSPLLNIFTSNSQWIEIVAKIASFFLTLVIIFFIGFFTNIWLGKQIYDLFEKLFIKLPLIGSIYSSLKKLFSFFSKDNNTTGNFQKVVFIPFPAKGTYCVAFSTGERIIDGQKYITTFMPTTPNPTTGFLMLVKEEDVIECDYTVEEAIQYIISAGIIQPDKKKLGEKNVTI